MHLLLKLQKESAHIFFGLLILSYFAIQPWHRTLSNNIWLVLSLACLVHVAFLYTSNRKEKLKTPKALKQILITCAIIPCISILSFLASPLNNLSASSLEPDTRWLLIIPIIISLRALDLKPVWVITGSTGYTLSAFASAFIETQHLQNLNFRASGDENAVTFGMFTATVSMVILAIFTSNHIKASFKTSIQRKLVRGGLLCVFALGVVTSFLSGTRAAVILIPMVVVVLYGVQYSYKRAAFGSSVLILIFGIFIYNNQQSAFVEKITTTPEKITNYLTNKDHYSKLTSTGQRLEIWKESWCIFKKHPLLGTGPRSFSPAHQMYGGANECNATQFLDNGFYQAHSVYFNTLGTLGILGIIGLGILFILSAKLALQTLKSSQHQPTQIYLGGLILLITLLSHSVNGLTVDLWFRNHVISKNLLIWALPLVLIFSNRKKKDRIKPISPNNSNL